MIRLASKLQRSRPALVPKLQNRLFSVISFQQTASSPAFLRGQFQKRLLSTAFVEKASQMAAAKAHIAEKQLLPPEYVDHEVSAFYNALGIDDMYFEQESAQSIGDNIIALYGAKIQALIRNEDSPQISLKREGEHSAIYIHTSSPGVAHPKGYENTIDAKYLDVPSSQPPFRLESYLSPGALPTPNMSTTLRCYLIRQCEFDFPNPTAEQARDINSVGDKNFLFRTTDHTKSLFEGVIDLCHGRLCDPFWSLMARC
jgi:glutamate dehydrogenase